uniref:Uncharacterized protein n=1 Tax=Ciona savignyi TaxID=51511 RepID=H2ZPH7_CIOSA
MATASLWNLLDIGNVTRIIQSTSKLLSEQTSITRMFHESLDHHSPVEGSGAEETSDDLERKLTSIVETDEENCDGIEEVIIVQGTDDFDDDSTQLSVDHDDHATMGTTENVQSDPISHQQHENKQMAGLAKVMCERLVQAALSAGAIENISVAIVLLKK